MVNNQNKENALKSFTHAAALTMAVRSKYVGTHLVVFSLNLDGL